MSFDPVYVLLAVFYLLALILLLLRGRLLDWPASARFPPCGVLPGGGAREKARRLRQLEKQRRRPRGGSPCPG
ncbi:hypothetical protein [Laribacter hongkongensis]|uniref:hypothetical protein n=1 Tax=Laribacter hongkongensis TaxID=168471 RepID=UPI000406F8EC|nr:hypothetical protein [Laribacter hongkongensis]